VSRAPDSRADKVAAGAEKLGLDAILTGDLVHPGDSERVGMADVAWVSGFTGTSGLTLIGPDVRTFFTDFRYSEQAREQVPGSFEIVEATGKMIPTIAEALSGRVGIDETKTSVDVHRKLRDDAADGVELIAAEGLLEGLRRVKDEREIAAIAEAARITDEAYAFIEGQGLAGRTEREVALTAEAKMRELGAEDPSFSAIVAAGPNGARPHAVPGDREIGEGEYVVVDMGAIVDGYCSDCTRTLVDGDPDPSHREIYELVLRAQVAALDAVRPGAHGRDVDAVARTIIEEGGHGERFGHGLGHGVGIEVHESPTLSKRSEDELQAGDVVTVEPGIYVPGEFGVRIEDLVVVTDDGPRILTSRPK
jgi:Xaa-Pro aminopeptidase